MADAQDGRAAASPAQAVGLWPLTDDLVPDVKALIADAVLEFYGDSNSCRRTGKDCCAITKKSAIYGISTIMRRYTALATAYFWSSTKTER